MKQLIDSELHDIETLDGERAHELCRLLECAGAVPRTYNQIMASASSEESRARLGALVVCLDGTGPCVAHQYLPLFCRHFGIRLLGLAKGPRIADRRSAAIFEVHREDSVFEDVCRLTAS